jgi:hypothetical protein
MLRNRLPLAPFRRFASLCAGVLLLTAGCQINLPMKPLLLNGPPVPGPLSSGLTPPLRLTDPQNDADDESTDDHEAGSSNVIRTSHEADTEDPPAGRTLPTPDTLPAPLAAAGPPAKGIAVNLDSVLRLTFERNGDILVARERVNESQIALDAALQSCMPEMLRKDTFKKAVAEATVWRRRGELRKTENDNLQDASNTYFDWLTAVRGEVVARDLMKYEEKLLDRARKLAEVEKPTQVLVNSTETALNGRQQFISQTHQQAEAAAAKLAYLMGINGGVPVANETLQPIDRVDTSVAVEVLVRQAQDNGPGVRELQGLIASIQQGIAQASRAQHICAHTGAALVCGRLQMAQSQLQQAQLALFNLQGKLRAGVEEAMSAILSGREQIARADDAIKNASETYRLMDLRLTKQNVETTLRNNTHNAVLTSIQQLSQAEANYLKAVSSYNKAQIRLLLLLGSYNECSRTNPPG